MGENNQYPAVRAMRICLACGGAKHVGALVCWECHNTFSLHHDDGHGPVMARVIQKAQSEADVHRSEC